MDMGEVLIITPCVGGVDLCACVRKREKERGTGREGNNVPAPPPTAWICHKRPGRERERGRNGERRER